MGTLNLATGVTLTGTGSVYSNSADSWGDAPAGTVIQVQTAVNNTDVTVANNTTSDIVTLSFTPKLSTSRLAIFVTCDQIRKTTGGTNWANMGVNNNTTSTSYIQSGALMYPDTNNDARIAYSSHTLVNSWGTTANTIAVRGSASGGSSFIFSHQTAQTRLTIMEITS